MANPRGTFAPELLPEGWFDETLRPEGWFSQDFLEPPSGGGVDATINGATLVETFTLIVGTLSGQANATFSGATLAETYSILPGSLSAGVSATFNGSILQQGWSIIEGGLSVEQAQLRGGGGFRRQEHDLRQLQAEDALAMKMIEEFLKVAA